jgi:periplasmic protein TonB
MSAPLVARDRDPLDAVLAVGRTRTGGLTAGVLVALFAHGAAAARAALAGDRPSPPLVTTLEIAVEPPVPPPPEERPKEEAPPAPVAPLPLARPQAAAPARAQAASPPPAAAAAAVLAKDPDPNEPVDMTNTFVTGTSASYAGGDTSAQGTLARAVHREVVGGPVGTADVRGGASSDGPDRSRAAGLAGSSNWRCPWPAGADIDDVNEAYVSVQVVVGPSGAPERVTVLSDPGHGFAAEAHGCAMRQSYLAALDHEGNPTRGSTKPFRIHLQR